MTDARGTTAEPGVAPRPRMPGWKTAVTFFVGVAAGLAVGLPTYGLLGWAEPPLPPPRLEATLYLPTADNQAKQPFPGTVWDGALEPLAREFGGYTLGPESQGAWYDGKGTVHREPVRLVTVSFMPSKLPQFRAACGEIARALRQQEVYVRYEQARVDLVPAPP